MKTSSERLRSSEVTSEENNDLNDVVLNVGTLTPDYPKFSNEYWLLNFTMYQKDSSKSCLSFFHRILSIQDKEFPFPEFFLKLVYNYNMKIIVTTTSVRQKIST